MTPDHLETSQMSTMQMNATRALSVLSDGGLVLLRTDVGYGLIGCSELSRPELR